MRESKQVHQVLLDRKVEKIGYRLELHNGEIAVLKRIVRNCSALMSKLYMRNTNGNHLYCVVIGLV